MLILGLIFILAMVQSLFGVGILLFGTPILLILGFDYQDALLNLLPASAALSWSQVWDSRHEKLDGNYRRLFFVLCLPALALGMLSTQYLNLGLEVKIFVTLMLFVAFVLRTSVSLRVKTSRFMKRHLKLALTSMGLIHGLSNMGGSVLSPLVSSLYPEKNKVLAGISFDYAFMASFQLLILFLIQGQELRMQYFGGAVVALAVRYLIGKRVFEFARDESYQKLINGFILANAIVLSLSLN